MRFTLPTHGNLLSPNCFRLGRDELRDLSRHVARRNSVRSRKLDPLDSERSSQVDDACFGRVVGALQLWDIGNVPAHGRRGDEAAVRVILERLARKRLAARSVLAPPNFARGFGAVKDAVEIRGDDFVVVGRLAVDHPSLSPRNAGVGDEDVKSAIELFRNVVDAVPDVFLVCHVNLVGSAFDAVRFLNVGGPVEGVFVAVVPDCYIGSGFCEGSGDFEANAGSCSRDYGCLVFEGKELVDACL